MRTLRRLGVALLLALALPAIAQAQTLRDRLSLNAAVGPSFANVGTTFSTLADVRYAVDDRVAVVGEFGLLRHAPFADAAAIAAPPAVPASSVRVNGYHWNGNLIVRPFEVGRLRPYVTGGLGTFTADTIVPRAAGVDTPFEDRRRMTDFSTNVGAGLSYPLNDWLGVGVDYRTFFVHRDEDTPRVHRFTTGLTLSVK